MGQIYKKIPEYFDDLGTLQGSIIEIGSSRPGDDNSSVFLYDLAQQLNVEFITCDIDSTYVNAISAKGVPAVCAKGEDFLNSYAKPISITYLDNYDWNWKPTTMEGWQIDQIEYYRKHFNISLNNVDCQIAHLVQAMRIEQLASEKSLIVFDDTWWYREFDIYLGKGGAAVPYLKAKGYQELHSEEYGTVLGRF